MIVQYHPLTASDLDGAISYYNQQRPGLGEEFRSEVYAAIERIRSNPFHYGVVDHDIRRCFVRGFPYGILFRIMNHETLRVLVIRHHRRRPGFGLTRQ
ncbi:MAG TPA: type II toxin-antitoxin system RelE/ParE family toxin [Candidatus Binatia bacterium]|jgi:plasmid stabilization system protein ParE